MEDQHRSYIFYCIVFYILDLIRVYLIVSSIISREEFRLFILLNRNKCFILYLKVTQSDMPASAHDRLEKPLSIQQNERVQLADKTDYVNSIQLTVNGRKYTVIRPDPKMVLNEWLRDQLHLKG